VRVDDALRLDGEDRVVACDGGPQCLDLIWSRVDDGDA
jgi:hypothetical protein